MIVKAKGRYMRVSSTKVKEVIDLIRGKNVHAATTILLHTNKGCTKSITKILNSAVSNAKEKGLADEQLFISRIFANQGPAAKRWRAAAFGRATRILKKTTHLTIELDLITK